MKKLIIGLLVVGALLVAFNQFNGSLQFGGDGVNFSYTSPTQSTTSVGIYNWETVLSADNSRGYATICDNANLSVSSVNPVYLAFGATSTDPYGYRLGSGECYEMTRQNMFYGAVYAIASTSTTTVLTITK